MRRIDPICSLSRRSPWSVGGGIGGMRAALDLADAGIKVYLIEHTPCLGGRVAQLGFMFPQHDCVLCRGTSDHGYGCTRPSISPAYIQHNRHPNIEIMTNTRVIDMAGQAGDFSVSLRQEPRYVDPARCINCGYCAGSLPGGPARQLPAGHGNPQSDLQGRGARRSGCLRDRAGGILRRLPANVPRSAQAARST